MATRNFHTLGLSQFSVVGTNPFASAINTTPGAIGSVITLSSTASWTNIVLDDDEGHLHDSDLAPAQTLLQNTTINGTLYTAGRHVETEYSYIMRVSTSSNPADNFRIYAISMDGVIVGFASDRPLTDGLSYRVIAEDSLAPSVLYTDLIVCFAAGTLILTPGGERPVESLRPGDAVITADDGPRPVVWAGRQRVRGAGGKAPIRVAQGALGAVRPLWLSPQHRVILPGAADEALVPVKALVGLPGIARVARPEVVYHHLLFDRHQVIFANGAPAESLYPGPMALRALGARSLAAIRAALPGFERLAPARRFLRPGDVVLRRA